MDVNSAQGNKGFLPCHCINKLDLSPIFVRNSMNKVVQISIQEHLQEQFKSR